ncbi:MAG: histidine kinase [Bacteroidota bacterium]|nr:histidine kinase [Bacteroidota bacterium]
MNQAQVDFQQLRIKHILFKSKVRSVLYGGTYDTGFFSTSGPLNAWFTAIGFSRYQAVPEMQKLKQIQQDLNTTANSLFSLYNGGRIEQAHDGLGKMEELSQDFINLLTKLEEKSAALAA